MSKYITIACDHCLRTLNVRTEYLGRRVTCNHCEYSFLARQADAKTESASSADFAAIRDEEARTQGESTPHAAPAARLGSRELRWDEAHSISTVEAGPGARRDAREEAESLHDRLRTLQERVERAEGLSGELQSARGENARLVTTAQVLKSELVGRIAEVGRLGRAAEELVARWKEEKRTWEEQAGRRLDEQLEAAKRQFERDSQTLRGEIETLAGALREARRRADLAVHNEGELSSRIRDLQGEIEGHQRAAATAPEAVQEALAAVRHELEARFHEETAAERERSDGVIDDLRRERDRLRAENDRLADGWSQAVASLEAAEAQHQDEFHAIGVELKDARHREDLANRREAELIGELQGLGAEHDRLRRELEAQRESQRELAHTLEDEREARLIERRAAERAYAAREERADRREAELVGHNDRLGAELDQVRLELEDDRRGRQEYAAALEREKEAGCQEELAAERGRAASDLEASRRELVRLGQQRDHADERAETSRRECDRLTDALAEAKARQEADDDLERAERAELTLKVEEARRQAERDALAAADRQEQLQVLRAELEEQRREIERDRRGYRDGLAAQRRDLEVEFRAEVARQRAESVQSQEERDGAIEQARELRQERDRQHDHHSLLETRLRELEEPSRSESERLSLESEVARRSAAEAAGHDLEGLHRLELDRGEGAAVPADPVPVDPGELVAIGPSVAPGSVEEDSPEDRLHSLRKQLRVVHEARSREPANRPFFKRLTEIWKHSEAGL